MHIIYEFFGLQVFVGYRCSLKFLSLQFEFSQCCSLPFAISFVLALVIVPSPLCHCSKPFRFLPSCETSLPFAIALFPVPSLVYFISPWPSLSPCFLSSCAINFSPLPLCCPLCHRSLPSAEPFSPLPPFFFLSGHCYFLLFMPRLSISLCCQSFPSTIALSLLPFLLQVFFAFHGFLPSTIALCAPFAIVLSHLLSFFPLYWTSLPSAIALSDLLSLSLLSHHTFSFLGLRFFLFPCAKNHSHLPLLPQVFFFFHGFVTSTIARSLLPLFSPF
jgi:hypothetical protein